MPWHHKKTNNAIFIIQIYRLQKPVNNQKFNGQAIEPHSPEFCGQEVLL